MANIHGGIILVCVGTFLLVLGKLEDPLTWDDAQKLCAANGTIVAPIDSMALLKDDIYIPRRSVWTSNFILNLGCIPNTDFCKGLLVEKGLNRNNYESLCYGDIGSKVYPRARKIEGHRKTTFCEACRGNTTSLIVINDMLQLKEAEESMFHEIKYWIGSFNINSKDSFVRQCEVFHKIANRTRPEKTNSNCDGTYQFICAPDTNYHTVISLIRLSNTATTTINGGVPYHQNVCQDITLVYVTGMVSSLAIIFGLFIIGCLLKRWMSKIKKELIETLRVRYDHHMYEVDQVEAAAAAANEPETPVSPGGSSLYENIFNDGDLTREANLTVSYMTSREIERPPSMPTDVPRIIPRLTFPKRLPSRENAIRHKARTSEDNIHPKPSRRKHLTSETSSASTSYQDCATPSVNQREVQNEGSNNNREVQNVFQTNKIKVQTTNREVQNAFQTNRRRVQNALQTNKREVENTLQTNNGEAQNELPTNRRELQSELLTNKRELQKALPINKTLLRCSGKKPKPSPKPDIKILTLKHKTLESKKRGKTFNRETNSEFAFYLNTSHDDDMESTDHVYINTGNDEETENHEHFYLNTGNEAEVENPEQDSEEYENIWQGPK